MLETLIFLIALILGLVGGVGAVVPGLPGPPLSYAGMLLLLLCGSVGISTELLVVSGIIMLLVTVVDYVLPVWFTQISGGSKEGVRGSLIGMILGLFFLPFGIIIGPFIGAFIGEYIAQQRSGKAFKVAAVSLLGFVATTLLKLVYSAWVLMYIIYKAKDLIF